MESFPPARIDMRQQFTSQAANVPASKRRFSPHQGSVAANPLSKIAKVSAGTNASSRFCPHEPVVPLSVEPDAAPRPPGPSVYAPCVPVHE